MKISYEKMERLCFYVLLSAVLSPIWISKYFLTGDGPCHLYTSRILLDWQQNRNIPMYSYFMTPNYHIDPNWITNLLQMPLLIIFSPPIAEKIFFTIYVIAFALGFRSLLKQININSVYLSALGLLFTWHHIVFKGFLNNTFSIALWFWTVSIWLKYREASGWKAVLTLMCISLLSYLAHPMGYIYAVMMIASILAGEIIFTWQANGIKGALSFFAKQASRLIIALLPSAILIFIFFTRREWSAETSDNRTIIKQLFQLPALVLFHSSEALWSQIISIACILLFITTLFYKILNFKVNRFDGIILFTFLVICSVVWPPIGMLGGLAAEQRVIILPFISIIFSAATITNIRIIRPIVLSFSIIIVTALLSIRIPIHKQLSDYADEIVSCKDKIASGSVVMTLNYDLAPHNVKGVEIIDAAWVNCHTDCYMGVYKPLIMADNYELNFDYFPFSGIWERNFYAQSKKNDNIFEGLRPIADLKRYYQKTGVQIQYVILAGLSKEKMNEPYVKDILQQLESDYTKIYTSANKIAALYHVKNRIRQPWEK